MALGTTALTGGVLVGFAAGVVLAPIAGGDRSIAIVTVLATAALADLIWLAFGRLRPLSINRQVPREWSDLFPAPVTAALYGGRLGIGPLTMLSTWLWWAGTIGSALLGVGPAVLFGAVFGLARALTTVLTSMWAEGSSHQQRFSRLRSFQRPGRLMIAASVVGGLLLGACSSPSRPELSQVTITPSTTSSLIIDGGADHTVVVTEPEATRITPVPDNASPSASAPLSPSDDASSAATAADDDESTEAIDPLEAALIEDVPGFAPINDPAANRGLDLDAAANIQPDPTEERPLLETRGFSRGWTRAFRSTDRDVVVVTVYEFLDETEAAFYLEDGLITIGGYGGEFFDIPDIEGSRGFRQVDGDQTADDSVTSVGVTFVRGTQWFLVYLVGAAETLDPQIVIDAARDQAIKAG